MAELDHWSSEALDCYDQLMERKPRGEQSAAKVSNHKNIFLNRFGQICGFWICLKPSTLMRRLGVDLSRVAASAAGGCRVAASGSFCCRTTENVSFADFQHR